MPRFAVLLAPLVVLTGCATEEPAPAPEPAAPAVATATVRLDPLGESAATGTVTFTETDGGLRVAYDLSGLELGEHGFHVHENGSCSPGDDGTPGGAAGGHFNPLEAPHGPQDAGREGRHVGDLGNVTSTAGGTTGGVAQGEFVDPILTLDGPTSIVGRAMMLHLKRDDLSSQPSGDAGDRIACGVIEMAEPTTAPAPAAE